MPRPFVALRLAEFAELLDRFDFTRRINAVHMHHTWRPNHAQYRGEVSIEAMWRFHTQERGWSDIAQHVSIAPDGTIWTGRNWNVPPASAAGNNGTAQAGPFMFETIGDFDRGRDTLTGRQRESVVGVIALVQRRFGLRPESLLFHNALTDQKTCPGSAIEYDEILEGVRKAPETLPGIFGIARGEQWATTMQARSGPGLATALREWTAGASRGLDPADAEPADCDMSDAAVSLVTGASATRRAPGARGGDGRRPELTPDMLAALRPHVINLNQGTFSSEGRFGTSEADVDAIFDQHLTLAYDQARAERRPLHLVFWAHGGLISESSGLWIAHQQTAWWKKNRIYPIHFVWETGFLDALRQILSGARRPAPRGIPRDFWDHTTDLALETVARTLGGGKIWAAMKRSAELAAQKDGGAAYVAKKLRAFTTSRPDVELHAVGHSAGAIFHSHFLPVAFEVDVPAFKTLQLLAPAIRVDRFKDSLLRQLGTKIQRLTVFTMQRDWEEDDNVAGLYRKSLLYLIHRALEPKSQEPILGLETSLRADHVVAARLGLAGQPSREAEVVWSVSEATGGRSASTSRTHGGFDNDRPTMNSVLRRILETDEVVEFPEEAVERAAALREATDWPYEVQAFVAPLDGEGSGAPAWDSGSVASVSGSSSGASESSAWASGSVTAPATPAPGGGGRRRAFCVGIDRYPTMPLGGCVADAREWAETVRSLGFETELLLDEAATRGAILDTLRRLIASSRAGDVALFQFAGHGTQLDDLDGDDVGGVTLGKDEALCPYDIADGAFVIDDDIAEVFGTIAEGVNVTCFIDCCHSGTVTRLMIGATQRAARDGNRRARWLPASPEMQAAHRQYRAGLGRSRSIGPRDAARMSEVLFSACLDSELAYESAGHGDFTQRATRVLREGIAGLSNEEFQRRVVAAFGSAAQQHPVLDCAPHARARALLQPLTSVAPASGGGTAGRDSRGARNGVDIGRPGPDAAVFAEAFRAMADVLQARG